MSLELEFDELLTSYLYDLYSMAYRLTGSKEAAEDLIQDLYVNLKVKDYQTQHVNNPKAWLASILYRLFVDQWRKESRSPIALGIDLSKNENDFYLDEYEDNATPGPLDACEQLTLNNLLQNALNKLSDKHRDIVIMHDVEGYTLHELHLIMNIPVGTLKSRLHRGREKLQEKMKMTISSEHKSHAYF